MTADERMEICKNCKLYLEKTSGAVCNSFLYINKQGEVSLVKKDGYKQGCGCLLQYKTHNPESHCIIGL